MHVHVKFRPLACISIRCVLFRMTAIFRFPCVSWILHFISINTVTTLHTLCKLMTTLTDILVYSRWNKLYRWYDLAEITRLHHSHSQFTIRLTVKPSFCWCANHENAQSLPLPDPFPRERLGLETWLVWSMQEIHKRSEIYKNQH